MPIDHDGCSRSWPCWPATSCSADEPEPTAEPHRRADRRGDSAQRDSRPGRPIPRRPPSDGLAAAAAPATDRPARPPGTSRAASEAIADPDTDAAGSSDRGPARSSCAYRVLGTRPGLGRRGLRRRRPGAARRRPRQRRRPPRVPVDALDAQRHAAGLADRRSPSPPRTCCASTEAAEADVRRRLGVPRRDQPGRDRRWAGSAARRSPARRGRCSSSRRPGRAGAAATSTTRPTRSWRRRATSPPTGSPAGRAGSANALYEYNNHPAYVRGVTAYAKVMERRPAGLPRLPPVGRLLPDHRGRRRAAGRLRAHAAGPGASVSRRAPTGVGCRLVGEHARTGLGRRPVDRLADPARLGPRSLAVRRDRWPSASASLHEHQGWPAPPPVVTGEPAAVLREVAEVRDVPSSSVSPAPRWSSPPSTRTSTGWASSTCSPR